MKVGVLKTIIINYRSNLYTSADISVNNKADLAMIKPENQ